LDWAIKEKFLLSTKLAYIQIHPIVLEANIHEIRVPAHRSIIKLAITLLHVKRIFFLFLKTHIQTPSLDQKNTSKVKGTKFSIDQQVLHPWSSNTNSQNNQPSSVNYCIQTAYSHLL